MSNKQLPAIKFNPDLESEAGKLYKRYCEENNIECRLTAAANFCLGYMVVKESQQTGAVSPVLSDIIRFKAGAAEYFMQHNYRELYGLLQNIFQLAEDGIKANGYDAGATAYATKVHKVETFNGLLNTEIKHLNTVIENLQAQPGDTFLLNRMGVTLENIYRIHSVQWNEHDRSVIKGILDQWEQSKKDAGPVNEAKDVFVPCAEDDPETCGSYTSHDGRSLCYVKVKHIPTAQLTQERADLIREANNRDLEGMVKATDTVTINMVNMNEVEKLKDELQQLRQWKEEAKQIIDPILGYAQGHKDGKLGGSCIEFVIDRCNDYDRLKKAGDQLVEAINVIYSAGAGNVATWGIVNKSLAEWSGEKEDNP